MSKTNFIKMKKITFLLALLIFVSSATYAQENPKILKDEFKITEVGFKDAWKNIKKGNKYYRQGLKGSYQMALEYYLKAVEYNEDYAPLLYKIGVCYEKASDEKNTLKYIKQAWDYDAFLTEDIHFWLGRAYHLNSQFSKAIDEYKEYRDGLDEKKLKADRYDINKYIEECQDAMDLTEKPIRILIDNVGESINSKYPDYAPVFCSYDSIILFTSRRDITMGGKRNALTNEYYEDIYFTSWLNGKWWESKSYGKPINSKGNDAAVAVSTTGSEMLIYRGKEKNGNIYKADFNFNTKKWKKPKKIIRKINTKKYRETTLTFSHDSTTIFFVSNNKKGVGGKDIWIISKKPNSNSGWSKPKNLGSLVNTTYDEEAVFLTEDDKTLYFASKGHNSMGGYDIFKTYWLPDGTFTKPENVGFPLNTPEDDMFFSISKNGRFGYYASKGNEVNYGDFDLYSVIFLGPEKPLLQENEDDLIAHIKEPVSEITMEEPIFIQTMKLTVVKGVVSEFSTLVPLEATVEIIDNATEEIIQTIKTNATTGEYMVMLPSGKNYGMSVSAENYMFHSENFEIPAEQEFQEIIKDVQLLPLDPGAKIVLNNVFFDTGKATLRSESYPELARLAQVFILYPKIIVEISGHTDSDGSDAANKTLSKNRAQAVVDYLVSIDVPVSQLVAIGYGEEQPRADNKTKEGKQLNRRVEAKILSK